MSDTVVAQEMISMMMIGIGIAVDILVVRKGSSASFPALRKTACPNLQVRKCRGRRERIHRFPPNWVAEKGLFLSPPSPR